MLYGPDGSVLESHRSSTRAERQEFQEGQIRERIKALDSLLDIVYVEWAGRYSLICNWPQGDARWPMYQNGEIGEHYDALGWFCTDMQNPQSLPVSLDDIENKVLELLASCDNDRQSWKSRMADHIKRNKQVKKDRQKIALDQVQDVTEVLWQAARRHDATKVERMLEEVAGGHV